MIDAHDRALARRAAAIALVAALVAALVVVTTDGGAPFSARLGMIAALAPVAGALGALAATRIAAGRGELRALSALGVDPARAARGAVLGGAAIGALGALLAASGLADLDGLFPRPLTAQRWVASGEGMIETTSGLRLDPGGALSFAAPLAAAAARPREASAFAVLAIALAALAAPLWIVALGGFGQGRAGQARLGEGGRGLWGLARPMAGLWALLSAIVAFQAVAATQVSPPVLLVPPFILLIDGAMARYRGSRDE